MGVYSLEVDAGRALLPDVLLDLLVGLASFDDLFLAGGGLHVGDGDVYLLGDDSAVDLSERGADG